MIGDILPVVVSVLSLGGLAGAIVALIKLRPEAGQIVVTAAQGALIVQAGVIDSLKDQNERQQARIAALEAENARLRSRVSALENELHTLWDEVHNGKGRGDHG